MATTASTEARPAAPRVSWNAATQMGGRLTYLLTRVALPPITLRYVSLDEYGIWSTCFLIIGYISIGAFGVSNVYIRFAAEYNAKGQHQEIGNLLGVGLAITLLFSAVAMAGLWFCLPWVHEWFKIEGPLQETADALILGTVATMLLDMSVGGYAFILLGINRIIQQTLVWIVGCLIETGLIVALLMEGQGVYGLLWAFVARYLFSITLYAVLCYRAIPGLRLSLAGGRDKLRLFLGYGGVLQLTGLVSIVVYSAERIFAGMLTGVGAVGLLDIGQKFPMMASQLFGSAQSSFLTALTHHHALDQNDEIVRLYLQGTRYLNLLNGLAMGFMAPFGWLIITAWMGLNPAYHDAATIMSLAAVGYHLHALTGTATSYFQGTHRPWRPLLIYMVPQIFIVGAALVVAVMELGETILAVVAAMAAARVATSLLFLAHANTSLRVSQWRFLWFVLLPGLAPYGIGYACEYVAHPWLMTLGTTRLELLPVLVAMGVVYGLVSVLVLGVVFSTREERGRVMRLLGRRR